MYTLVYSINDEEAPETVYVNLTNSCTNKCIFCLREQKDDVCGAQMWHDDNYKLEDLINQFNAYKIRVNTNGHANAIYKTNVAAEFKGLIDAVSVSLNASSIAEYNEICNPKIENAYEEVKKFIKACVNEGMDVSASVVTGFDKLHNIDIKQCEAIASSLGAKFRNREFIPNGY